MIRNRTAILALLTGLNFVNYLDRFIVAAVLPQIQKPAESGGLGLTNFEGGLLATVFLLGYFVTAPLFGTLGDRMSRKVLITAGVVMWSVATVASGLADGLGSMLVARAFVGIGEASYATLAPTIIDDITPPEKKGKALAIFYVAIPLGSACGYLFGGMLQEAWGWRAAFFVAGGPGIALALLCLAIAEPVRVLAHKAKLVGSLGTLARIPLYRRAVLGYCAHTAAIGAFAYWGPKFLSQTFAVELAPDTWASIDERDRQVLASANFWFGTVTVIAGALGTLIGGRLADRAVRGLPTIPADVGHDDPRNRLAANAQLKVCAIGCAIAFPLAALAFLAPGPVLFFTLAGLAEIGLFMSTAPINAILLRTAPAYLRASAMAVAIFAIHLFGDLWSPSLVGLLLDYLVAAAAMMALPLGFAIATAVWWPRRREAGHVGPL
jgi:MFS transporter, Spinster family, sphingosine-1-phosphate transporter